MNKSGIDKTALLSIVTHLKDTYKKDIPGYLETLKRARKIEEEANIPIDRIYDRIVEERESIKKLKEELRGMIN